MRGLFAVALLVFTVLGVNLVQVFSLVIRPVSRRAFRKANRAAAGFFWRLCVWVLEAWLKVEFVWSGDETPRGENVILISNHQSGTDILAVMPLALRKGRIADMKWMAKEIIKYVPGIGWGMLFLDCVFLRRDWAADAARVHATFSRLNDGSVPFWFISFPEGTRITPHKLELARKYAHQLGLPVPNHVMVPRTKGFTASVEGLRNVAHAVYDVTLAFEPGIPTLLELFSGDLKRIHVHVRRFEIGSLPLSEAELSQWLYDRFVEKDRLLENFKRTKQLK